MKTQWEIDVPLEEKERIAITYGDPADALSSVDKYALNPLPEAISNWHAIIPLLKKDHWYDITAFYSRRKDLNKENSKLLFEFNQKAYDAANAKGGLVLYFQGVLIGKEHIVTNPNLELSFVPNCLSFCIWETLEGAKEGAKIPAHKQAVQMTSLWFEGFAIKKYEVMVVEKNRRRKLIFKLVNKVI
jgi:hypothetical protein